MEYAAAFFKFIDANMMLVLSILTALAGFFGRSMWLARAREMHIKEKLAVAREAVLVIARKTDTPLDDLVAEGMRIAIRGLEAAGYDASPEEFARMQAHLTEKMAPMGESSRAPKV